MDQRQKSDHRKILDLLLRLNKLLSCDCASSRDDSYVTYVNTSCYCERRMEVEQRCSDVYSRIIMTVSNLSTK